MPRSRVEEPPGQHSDSDGKAKVLLPLHDSRRVPARADAVAGGVPSLAAVKREQCSGRKARWDPVLHFTHQVALVRQLIPSPREWEIFQGSLGTGIVGVRPKATSRSAVQPGFVILFVNAASARLQESYGKTISGFVPMLDRAARTLKWESQRSDHQGQVIARIFEHVHAGRCEVVVAVRATPGTDYAILGRTREICLLSPARFLVNGGDHLVAERGSNRIHRYVTAQCIDAGLKAGVGLVPCRYPVPAALRPLYCSGCCWAPASALLRFETLDEEAARIMEMGGGGQKGCTSDAAVESAGERPLKRLRGKQAPPSVAARCSRRKSGVCDAAVGRRSAATQRTTLASNTLAVRAVAHDSFRLRWRRSVLGKRRASVASAAGKPRLSAARPRQAALIVERQKVLLRLAAINSQLADPDACAPDASASESGHEGCTGPAVGFVGGA